jgi:HK97 family phage portal protein
MSLFASARQAWKGRGMTFPSASQMIPQRGDRVGGLVHVDNDSALRHSAVWAALTLRAGLVSTCPLDVFRYVHGIQVEAPRPPVLVMPGGERCGLPEWLFSSQFEIDRTGNAIGIITKRDGNGLPAEIELQSTGTVTIVGKGPRITGYRIGGTDYLDERARDVWHEKGVTVPGVPVGLSPVAYAAQSIGGYLSAQQFATDWFAAGPHPKGTLRHTEEDILPPGVSEETKRRFKNAVAGGDIFVTGKAWEYTPETQSAAGAVFLDEMKFGIVEIGRFFGVPADLLDGAVAGSAVTYANITQRNLQFLIMQLGPAFARREWALSHDLLAAPRFVKFNTDALLRMDPETRSKLLGQQVRDRLLAPSEARALENREPFNEDQLAEFDRMFGAPKTTPTTATAAG